MLKKYIYLTLFLLFTKSLGQVGINTVNPQSTFHVDGAKDNPIIGVPSLSQQSNDFIVNSSGNTGIGTTSPSNKLHVVSGSNPLRLSGLVNAQKSDSILTVDASTGVVRMRSASILSGNSNKNCSPDIMAGTISHNQPYGCIGYDPGVFVSSPADPGIGGTVTYTWQQSTDGGNTWTAVPGNSNLQNYDPPALTLPTKFRRVALNYCGVVYSNIVDIAINGSSSGITVEPCSINAGGSFALSIGLYTGSSVINWSVSPSSGLSFSSTSTNITTLLSTNSTPAGIYTITATITSASCGTKSFTKDITIVPSGIDLNNLKRSCKQILDSGMSIGNGIYWIDPDGNEKAYCAEKVYCNMTDNGGGWTLILKSMNNNNDFKYNSPIWQSGATFNVQDFDINNSNITNALYNPYNYLNVKEFWVDFINTPDLVPFAVPVSGTPKNLANATLNSNISNQYLNQPYQSSGMNSTYFTPPNAYNYQTGGVGNGVNLGAAFALVRFGMLSNNETNEIFGTSDSAIGIGAYNKAAQSGTVPAGATVGDFGSGNAYYPIGTLFYIGMYGLNFYKALLWAR